MNQHASPADPDPEASRSPGVGAEPGVDALLTRVRPRITRYEPIQAAAAYAAGARMIDIRPEDQRRRHGRIPGAVVIDRNILEWRLDPLNEACIPGIARSGADIIIYCQEGYASSLAVASLQSIGVTRAVDLIGGLAEWRAVGLPIVGGQQSP